MNKTKYILLSIFVSAHLLTGTLAFAQQSKVDSLLTLLLKDKEDTIKVMRLNTLSREYIDIGLYDKALNYANTAMQLAQQLNYQKGIANSCNNFGITYRTQGDYPKALDYYLRSLKIDEELGDKNGIARHLGSIGNVYSDQEDYTKALDYYFKALKIKEEIGDKNGIATWLGNIGIVYEELASAADDDSLINREQLFSKALDNFSKALKITEEIGDKSGIATWLSNIGLVYEEEGEALPYAKQQQELYEKALEHFLKSLKIAEEFEYKQLQANILGNMGSLYSDMKKYAEAEKYLQNALKLDRELGAMDDERDDEKDLSELYEKTNRYQLALEHFKKVMTLKDTLFNADKNKELTQKEMNFEFEKKEAIQKAEQEKQTALAAAESKKQKIVIWSVIAVLALVLVFAGLILRSLRLTRKQKQVIEIKSKETEVQKQIIEEKNKDITDSIHYASRIQRALLTSHEFIGKHLKDYFILFKPKDIVSGDFYWANSVNGKFLLCTADCTGHGVPGAFMSLLNISILNEITIEKKVTSPDLILNYAREEIISALNPEGMEVETKDGMDCVFCTYDPENMLLHFAGANNPMWIVRDNQLLEFKPDKMPVGKYNDTHKPFSLQTINLQKGDIIYTFTDGFADQFGGTNGKKFKYKQLHDLLSTISMKPLLEQKTILENAFENWKGDLEQVDDVLVIGLKI